MDVERSLVSKIAQSQSMQAVVARSIEPEHFLQRRKGDADPLPLPGEVYSWQVDHLRRFRNVPSFDLTRRRWPKFELIEVTDSLEAVVEEMVRLVKRRILIDGIRQLSDIADDPVRVSDAEVHVYEVASELARSVPTSAITRLSDSLSRLDLYRERQRLGHAPGISLVMPQLDNLTYGLQSHELLIWEGFLGVGKSSIGIAQCAKGYIERDQTPLVLSLEMEGQKLANKWDAMMSKISYNALKMLELGAGDLERWERFGEKADSAKFDKDILVIDDIHRCTVDRVYTEVERWRPDFTIVDTIDEVRAPSYLRSHWEQQAWAARELKGIARATKRPLIGMAQAGRDAEEEGATLGNIAGSIDIARKADLVVGLHASPPMKRANKMELRMLKNRDGEGDGVSFSFFWDIANMIFRPWTPADNVPTPPSAAAAVPA